MPELTAPPVVDPLPGLEPVIEVPDEEGQEEEAAAAEAVPENPPSPPPQPLPRRVLPVGNGVMEMARRVLTLHFQGRALEWCKGYGPYSGWMRPHVEEEVAAAAAKDSRHEGGGVAGAPSLANMIVSQAVLLVAADKSDERCREFFKSVRVALHAAVRQDPKETVQHA